MSISGSRWSFKTSAINGFIQSLNTDLFIYIVELVQNIPGITVKYEIRNWLTRRRPGTIPLPSQQIFSIIFQRFSVLVILRHFRDPSLIDIISYCSKYPFICHNPLTQLVASTNFSTYITYPTSHFILLAIFNYTIKWIRNTHLTLTTYFSSFNNSRRKQLTDAYYLFATTLIKRQAIVDRRKNFVCLKHTNILNYHCTFTENAHYAWSGLITGWTQVTK
jgi:hypothetical protein